MLDVSHQLASQIGHRGEDAAGDDVAFDLGKPEFDLVQPGRIRRRVMQADRWVRRQERADLLRLMGREIVDDDVDRAPARLGVDDRLEERHELVTRVTRHRAADDFPGVGIERRIQREGSMTVVLESVPFGKEPETQFAIALAPTMRA